MTNVKWWSLFTFYLPRKRINTMKADLEKSKDELIEDLKELRARFDHRTREHKT